MDESISRGSPGRLKILFVIGTLDVGGTEQQLVKLATGLDRGRFEPVVCCLSARGVLADRLTDAGIRVKSFDFRGIRRQRSLVIAPFAVAVTLIRLYRWVRSEAPDLVHGMLFHAYVIGTLIARAACVPVVVSSRRSLSHFKEGKPHYRIAEKVVNRMTDLVIGNSEAVRRDALNTERLLPEKVRVVYNGLDIDRFTERADEGLREEIGLPPASPVVAVVANFIHYKGHNYFLEAWSRLVRGFPDAVALLVGDGPLREPMEREAAERGVADSLRFLGTRHDVPAILALSDLLVHPSLEEGFSNAIIEAMAAGKAVVATRVGGNPEAVEDGVTGLLIPARDSTALATAVIRLLERPEERQAFGERGRRRAARLFSVGRLTEQYERVYEELAVRKGLWPQAVVREPEDGSTR